MDPIRLRWVGGEHDFAIHLKELRMLQTVCDAGPMKVFRLLHSGDWRDVHVLETLRCGLIGGGMDPIEAGPLVTRMCEERGSAHLALTATAVILHALYGPEDDQPEKPEGEAPTTPESGASPISTPLAQ